jgi:hypothetical protein
LCFFMGGNEIEELRMKRIAEKIAEMEGCPVASEPYICFKDIQ